MRPSYAAWIVFAAVWAAGAFRIKRTEQRAPGRWQIRHVIALAAAFNLLANPFVLAGALAWRVVPAGAAWWWTGEAMQCAGIAFAIWARLHIGRNWSGMVDVKQDHALIRSGPYTIVRHPIYTGLLVAVLGVALEHGRLARFLAFALLLLEWKVKSLMEERVMLDRFGGDYSAYRKQVKALVPLVW